MAQEITIKLLESKKEISRKITQSIAKELSLAFRKAGPRIAGKIRSQTQKTLEGTEIYQSLVSGELSQHFGFERLGGRARVDEIVATIVNNINVKYESIKAIGSNLKGGLSIGILLEGFTDILGLPASVVVTEKGQALPWLEWLLIRGDSIIITEHSIRFEPGRGRSGGAIMIQNNAGVWRVPPEYAGTVNDNWLTRGLIDASNIYISAINSIVKTELERTL